MDLNISNFKHDATVSMVAIVVLLVLSISTIPMVSSTALGVLTPTGYRSTMDAPSVQSLGKDTFTTQAVLSGSGNLVSNDIVHSKAIYEIVFNTASTGPIKTVEITFPPGTSISSANIIESVGIGPGTVTKAGTTMTLNVNDPVVIPAGTWIRLEITNINNPPTPSSNYQVTITTRNSNLGIIDSGTSVPYTVRQLGTNDMANGVITASKVASSFMVSRILQDGQNGWNPDATLDPKSFIINDAAVQASNSHVYVSVDEPNDTGALLVDVVCMVEGIVNGQFEVVCDLPPGDGSKLRYTVINQP